MKSIKLTLFERSILECGVNHGYEWIARDEDEQLYLYRNEPKKVDAVWYTTINETYLDMPLFDEKFQFIKWEDKEPVHIPTLLETCEVMENG